MYAYGNRVNAVEWHGLNVNAHRKLSHTRFDNGCIIIRESRRDAGDGGLADRYTRNEVGRILGLEAGRLRYWERLRLVRPEARWGERFYSFGDLVALRSIQRITLNRVPARKLRRAVALVEQQFGGASLPLQQLRLVELGRDVLVVPPGADRPFNPFRQQWAFPFDIPEQPAKLHAMAGPTPEEFFETALSCETKQDMLPQAIENYQRVVELAPDWIEAHINLGVAYYQMGQLSDARAAFVAAVALDPLSGISRYNLGCTLEELGEYDLAVEHLQRAARAMPGHADVHFNLALAYEKRGERRAARDHWTLYLRHAPNGTWAEQARARLRRYSTRRKNVMPIPFRRPS
jgi:tetratricopeptide (TPR) repeat protein